MTVGAGLVLCLQVLTLSLSLLHYLPTAGHIESVFSDSVFSAAVRRSNYLRLLQRRKCCVLINYLCRPCAATLDMIFRLWKPYPHPPPST